MPKVSVLLSPRFLDRIKELNAGETNKIEEVLQILPDCFGHPHLHTGTSIRRLTKNVFECRAGLRLRLLFRVKSGSLEIFFVGNHDEVRRFIRSL